MRDGLLGALTAIALAGAGAGEEAPRARSAPAILFREIGAEAGAAIEHRTRRYGERHKAQVLEMFTSGGAASAVGDYDGDGYEDLFVTDSGLARPCSLLHNLGAMRFEEVGSTLGVDGGNDDHAIVSDALWLDFDNDGDLDLLIARFGTPLLYRQDRNEHGGISFVEVAASVGLTTFANTVGVITFDADRDGFLDLLFANYFRPFDLLALDTTKVLPNDLDRADNGGGVSFWSNRPAPERADSRAGARRFVDATEAVGLADQSGWSLDLGHADLDNDGWQDVYVAGDYGTDRLFFNRGDGSFRDATAEAIGFDTKKGMNVDIADFDRDGWLDIYVTNITDEYMRECNMLWRNNGDGSFSDVARETGTCDTDWGWAGKFADFDHDGWQDLLVTNGLISAGEENYIPLLLEALLVPGVDFSDLDSYPDIEGRTWSGNQPTRLFHNRGGGQFVELAERAGIDNQADGRGLAIADLDNDGALDVYQSNADGVGLLYHAQPAARGSWIELVLIGDGPSNRDAIGARIRVRAGSEEWIREIDGGNGYSSQSSRRVHIGLGAAHEIDSLEIRWPTGNWAEYPPVSVDVLTTIREIASPKKDVASDGG